MGMNWSIGAFQKAFILPMLLLASMSSPVRAQVSSAAPNLWQSIGPFGGDYATRVIIPRESTTRIYATGAKEIFRSDDYGNHWTNISNISRSSGYSGSEASLIISRADTNVLYVIANGQSVLRSSDAGDSWQYMYRDSIHSLVFLDPRDSNVLIARKYLSNPYLQAFVKSTDGGNSWSDLSRGIDTTMGRLLLYVNPFSLNSMLAFQAVSYGSDVVRGYLLYRTNNGGESWVKVTALDSSRTMTGAAFDAQNPDVFYVQSGEAPSGILKTTDAGLSWFSIGNGLPSPPTYRYHLVTDPSRSSVLYTYDNNNLYRSSDGGLGFTQLHSFDGVRRITSITVDPHDPASIFVGTFPQGIYYSDDAGVSWRHRSAGLTMTEVPSIACISVDTVFACVNNMGLLRTTNGGEHWETLVDNTSSSNRTGIKIILGDSPSIYTALVPSTWYWHPAVYDSSFLARSDDAGENWDRILVPFRGVRVFDVSSDKQILYANAWLGRDSAGLSIAGVIKSSDAGKTWLVFPTGYTANHVEQLVVDPSESNIVYALVWLRSSAPKQVNKNIAIRSTDGGFSWSSIADSVAAFMMHPLKSETIFYVSHNGFNRDVFFKSTNRGNTWTGYSVGHDIKNITAHPLHPEVLYGVTYDGSVVRSDNEGESWSTVEKDETIAAFEQVALAAVDSTDVVLFGATMYSGVKSRRDSKPTSIRGVPEVRIFDLLQHYPNPVSSGSGSIIPFSLTRGAHARLVLFDLMGRAVRTLADQPYTSGSHTLFLDAGDLPPGMYLYALTVDSQTTIRNMLVIR
jgi:photosystem II stability/assembly factor-like uncharacterized protein